MQIFLEYGKVGLWMTPILLLGLWLLPRLSQRYTAKLSYMVWLVVAVRLLLPWNLTLPEGTAPIQLDIPRETRWVLVDLNEEGGKAVPLKTEAAGTADTDGVAPVAKTPARSVSPLEVAAALWLTGGILSLLRTGASTLRLKRLLKRWEREPAAETLAFYRETIGGERPPLAICPAIETPMAMGLFHTKIYLPHEAYSRRELEMILRHEWIHWHRKDLWYKGLLILVRSIYWYHPLVWLMAKRADRALEISCDGEAVRGMDAAYRRAYSLMILQEAERNIQKQMALTTCFTDGKKALQERLVEILNGEKRKKGMALIAVTLALTVTCGCMVSYGGADEMPPAVQGENILQTEEREIAVLWAEALTLRDGEPRYARMGEKAKEKFAAEQMAIQGEDWDFNIGWSSPWVMSYDIEEGDGKATITYTMQDSEPRQYMMKEILKFGKENGRTVVTDYLTSNLYWEDGKVHPATGRTGMEPDEGIWDFLYQSVEGFFSQGKWQIYEMEEYNFKIENVETERLANGRDQVSVDFGLNMKYRNPFRDPDEATYIQNAKAKGEAIYDTLYREYYAQQEANTYLRFTCEVQPGAERITEDNCFPDTFRLYVDDGDPHLITFEKKILVAEAYLEEEEGKLWQCRLFPGEKEGEVTVERQLFIRDTSGRTEYNYFWMPLGDSRSYPIQKDILVRVDMDEAFQPVEVTAEAFSQGLAQEETGWSGAIYTISLGEGENADRVITKIRAGYSRAATPEEEARWANQNSVPSGYPTESKTISAPFSLTERKNPVSTASVPGAGKHLGIDFSSDGKEIPVSATADGIVLEAGFNAQKGNYVKINHMNGFTTLYAHLSRLDVKAGAKVQKGDMLGMSGKTGMATGVHCHYEVQLNGIYQDPANYL